MEGEGRIFVNDWRVLPPSTCPTVSQERELRAPGGRGQASWFWVSMNRKHSLLWLCAIMCSLWIPRRSLRWSLASRVGWLPTGRPEKAEMRSPLGVGGTLTTKSSSMGVNDRTWRRVESSCCLAFSDFCMEAFDFPVKGLSLYLISQESRLRISLVAWSWSWSGCSGNKRTCFQFTNASWYFRSSV